MLLITPRTSKPTYTINEKDSSWEDALLKPPFHCQQALQQLTQKSIEHNDKKGQEKNPKEFAKETWSLNPKG